ncbi:acetyl/propionyl/methylcrotonyl-CoA carboxylase subunit alpha [Oceanisphaera arctica]|uniref:Biotin carboxylase n=1 Tax=Oceanisphaera arctica TaxID=641510 RepID=A0A2P5TJK1_9GAMM|nr:acetyl/propionyl/methylcrotonyl-CoA carboxylase subunit alpha [Oceanisphaera arctica]PPL15179.1 3-methylcrotonyl-CoA carboxylase [Oceanisphaera arctica]GHA04024.1 methylcrotonyl-CoA carboxylase subunit alpha [Oceanisphaera arctica]
MFDKILIANRGEIACRIIRTARRLGIVTVAVYSDVDARAAHLEQADEAWRLGPAPAAESYLRQDKLLDIARACGAEAIHPGYGFLSENAGFAHACAEQGLVFIGPPASAIESMGSKSAAKTLMSAAGVPVVPGYHGSNQDADQLRREAERCGFPLLLKAVAGGGGKGMRVVHDIREFDEALASARREAKAAFGDDAMLLERYLPRARHVEVQVFCDQFGHGIYLSERDCSVQRRHQKVLEEAPAPNLSPQIRLAMGEAAVKAALAIDYRGAGTLEFLYLADGSFFFMEMNTRLQVEHPVTELVTGLDLVEWQLRVAAGEPLPLTQEQVKIRGHAVEARVYAEDPEHDFLPAAGTLHYLHEPVSGAEISPAIEIRLDTGVRQGDEVGIFYDPLIAKLIVWAESREQALRQLANSLAQYRIGGVRTNLRFLQALAESAPLRTDELHTGFIEQHSELLFAPPGLEPSRVLALCAAFVLLTEPQTDSSPFAGHQGWWLNLPPRRQLALEYEAETHRLDMRSEPDGWWMTIGGRQHRLTAKLQGDRLQAVIDGVPLRCHLARHNDQLWLFYHGERFDVRLHNPDYEQQSTHNGGNLSAPMPGMISQIKVAVGESVAAGQTLLILEAMKMEHPIVAPTTGRVAELYYREGSQVSEGAELLRLEPEQEQETP